MIDDATLADFYRDAPPDILERFRQFLASHSIATAEVDGVEVSYYACGEGRPALVAFCGGHSTPYSAWEMVETYEGDHQVLVLDVSGFGTVAALVAGIDRLLDREGVDRVVLLGTSLAGLIAQIYLKYAHARIDGVVLMNTGALKPGGDKPISLMLLKSLPEWLLRRLFLKKLRRYFEIPLADPRSEKAARFSLALFEEVMANHFTKRKLVNLLSVLFEFGRDGYRRADLEPWGGRALIVSSEDDAGFADVDWLVTNVPRAETYVFPAGLGHLPQLVHREKFESLIRSFVERLP